jgi:hypothetical protein
MLPETTIFHGKNQEKNMVSSRFSQQNSSVRVPKNTTTRHEKKKRCVEVELNALAQEMQAVRPGYFSHGNALLISLYSEETILEYTD